MLFLCFSIFSGLVPLPPSAHIHTVSKSFGRCECLHIDACTCLHIYRCRSTNQPEVVSCLDCCLLSQVYQQMQDFFLKINSTLSALGAWTFYIFNAIYCIVEQYLLRSHNKYDARFSLSSTGFLVLLNTESSLLLNSSDDKIALLWTFFSFVSSSWI